MSEMAIFGGVGMQVIDHKGDRWMTMRDLSRALGYTDELKVRMLVDRNPYEFTGKQGVLKMSTPGGPQDVRILNYRGVIRVAMKSNAPKAIKFRDWAEEVLFQVMTKGYYATGEKQNTPHWTDELSADSFLELTKLRVQCWVAIADRPRNQSLWSALYETYGGRRAYQRYLKDYDLPVPESRDEWQEFQRQATTEDGRLADYRVFEYGDSEEERPAANGPESQSRKDN